MSKILARSPYWIKATVTDLVSASMELCVYEGTVVTSRPSEVSYTINSTVTDTPNTVYWDISDLVKDFIDTRYTGSSSDNGVVWVDYRITTNTTSAVSQGSIQTGDYAVYGYSYYEQGYNNTPLDGCLIDTDLIYNLNGNDVIVPLDYRRFSEVTFFSGSTVLLNQTNTTPSSNIESSSIVSSLGEGLNNVTQVRIESHNGPEITVNGDFATDTDWTKGDDWSIGNDEAFLDSSDLSVQLLYQDSERLVGKNLDVSFTVAQYGGTGNVSMRYPFSISITGNGTYQASGVGEFDRIQFQAQTTDEQSNLSLSLSNVSVTESVADRIINVEDIEECKYTPYKIIFRNKLGAKQELWFFKSSRLSMQIERDKFQGNTIKDYRNDIISSHRGVNFSTMSKQTLTINSGFVPESFNEVFKQLMLSEQVWIDYNQQVLPINISNQSIDYKTSLNNKLINYTIDVEFSFNTTNNVR